MTVSDCDGGVVCAIAGGGVGTGVASAPPLLLLPLLAAPPVLNLFTARGKGNEDTLAPDEARALVDLVTLGVTPLMGGGNFADAALFRAPAEEPLQACFREFEEDGAAEADAKGVVGREAEPRELVLGPATSLASLLTPR